MNADKAGADPAPKKKLNHESYEKALKLAREKLGQVDFIKQCRAAGAEIIGADAPERKVARIKFLGRDYLVEHPSGLVRLAGSEKEPRPYDRIIILHYLQNAGGTEKTGELISYQQIPDGWLYYASFRARTTQILARTFGADTRAFLDAGLAIGAAQSSLGQYALEVFALPKVSYHLIMWPGDDELDTEFSCVFDRSITDYLPAEDITVLANVISSRLMDAHKQGAGQ
jgi:hypothetical protein